MHVKFSALNVDFNRVSFDPLGSRGPLYECIKFGSPLQNAIFLLLSSIMTSLTADWQSSTKLWSKYVLRPYFWTCDFRSAKSIHFLGTVCT